MKKILTLIKVSLNHDMNLFKIQTKKQGTFSKYAFPIMLALIIMTSIGAYAVYFIESLKEVHLEFVLLTIFSLAVCFLTIMEGVYKAGTLLFDCKDDQLLFSLPVKRRTVLFIRIFKFYAFEFVYNSLFLLPAIIVYAVFVNPSWTYYLVSLFALILLPVIPVILTCIIGFLTTFVSSKARSKSIVQTVFTTIVILGIFFITYNTNSFMTNIAQNASNINDLITRLYYPVGAYISLINDFNVVTFLIFIFSHIIIFTIAVLLLGKIYFNINSNNKEVIVNHKNTKYKIKSHCKLVAFIKKELNRLLLTPVFIANAGFSLILYLILCIAVSIKYDAIIEMFSNTIPVLSADVLNSAFPVVVIGVICFIALMTSITSSMISLEGRSFNILKSLPLKTSNIILYKIIASLVIMLPCIFLGDLILIIRFRFDIISIILIILGSVIFSFVSELIGIICNLKYPKLDASNDTEIVKQSMSATIAVFIGFALVGLTVLLLVWLLSLNLLNHIIMFIVVGLYALICLGLWLVLVNKSNKWFNNIDS